MNDPSELLYNELRQNLLFFRGSDKYRINQLGMSEFPTIFEAVKGHLEGFTVTTEDDLYAVTRVGKFFGRQFPHARKVFLDWLEAERKELSDSPGRNEQRLAVLDYFRTGLDYGQLGTAGQKPVGELYEVIFPRMEQGSITTKMSSA